MPELRAVCFDLFNTLASVGRVPLSVGRFTADILGIDRQRWREACFGPEHVIWQTTDAYQTLSRLAHSIDPTIPATRIRQALEARQARFDHALLNIEPAILQALARIRDCGVKLGLISNASSSEVQAWPDSPLAELFDVAQFSCHCGQVKPDKAIYSMTLDALAVSAGHCLYVGDGGSDEHHGAYHSGMKPVLISHYLHKNELSEHLARYREVLFGVVRDMQQLEAYCVAAKKRGRMPPLSFS